MSTVVIDHIHPFQSGQPGSKVAGTVFLACLRKSGNPDCERAWLHACGPLAPIKESCKEKETAVQAMKEPSYPEKKVI